MSFLCDLGGHKWQRVYAHAGTCEVQYQCERCHAVGGQPGVFHQWEWKELSPCLRYQVCRRCGAEGLSEAREHEWKIIQQPNSYQYQETCLRCGVVRTNELAIASFVGQEVIKANLGVLILAARLRGEAAPHLLFSGSMGMGKTILGQLVAKDMGAHVTKVYGSAIDRAGDFATIITNMHANDVLLIEQLESLRRPTLEVLIPALQDFTLEIVIGKGPSTRRVSLKLPHFTLIGTSLIPRKVDTSLRDLLCQFAFVSYDEAELSRIVSNAAQTQHIQIEPQAALQIAEKVTVVRPKVSGS